MFTYPRGFQGFLLSRLRHGISGFVYLVALRRGRVRALIVRTSNFPPIGLVYVSGGIANTYLSRGFYRRCYEGRLQVGGILRRASYPCAQRLIRVTRRSRTHTQRGYFRRKVRRKGVCRQRLVGGSRVNLRQVLFVTLGSNVSFRSTVRFRRPIGHPHLVPNNFTRTLYYPSNQYHRRGIFPKWFGVLSSYVSHYYFSHSKASNGRRGAISCNFLCHFCLVLVGVRSHLLFGLSSSILGFSVQGVGRDVRLYRANDNVYLRVGVNYHVSLHAIFRLTRGSLTVRHRVRMVLLSILQVCLGGPTYPLHRFLRQRVNVPLSNDLRRRVLSATSGPRVKVNTSSRTKYSLVYHTRSSPFRVVYRAV